jgi:hypothetical protein
MWIELTENCLPELLAKGWSVSYGKKSYLISPEGIRYELDESSCELRKSRRGQAPLNLYVIQARGSARFKIGISETPTERLRTMQIGSPLDLELVCAVAIESRKVEALAHELLANQHHRGEWFDLGEHAEAFRAKVEKCQAAKDVLTMLAVWSLSP